MRVLHSTLSKKPIPGIVNQIYLEQLAAESLGITWESILCVAEKSKQYSNEKKRVINKLKFDNWFLLRLAYYKLLMSKIDDFDVLLLRHNTSNPLEYYFLKKINKPVFLVHHTLEGYELLSNSSIKAKIKYSIERLYGDLSIKNAHGIIGVTDEIFSYENKRTNNKFKNKITYPNGIFYNGIELLDSRDLVVPEILFIASDFVPWHGLDLILNELKNTNEEFILNIVGKVYQADISKAKKDNRVILHGLLNKDEMTEIIERSWIGLSSFALERKNMKEACTLKVREYLNGGLPVYSGHRDIFPESFPYYKEGKPEFNEILSYAKKMRLMTKEEVRVLARPYIDKTILLETLYKNIKEY